MYSNNKQYNTEIDGKQNTSLEPIKKFNFLYPEIRDVDFSQLSSWNISSSSLDQIERNGWINIKPDQLEDFIERYVRYFTEEQFKERRSNVQNPKKIFFNAMKVISEGKPDPLSDIKTQFELIEELSFQNKLKAMEIRRKEFEANEKQMDQYRDSEFEHWVQGLADEEKVQFALPSKMAELGSGRHKLLLKDYFTQNVWPEIKQNVLMAPRN
jgi:hypothetical protein